ncbi:MAG: hypothetical protein AAB791_01505 [Patescibacteria group bacterium]
MDSRKDNLLKIIVEEYIRSANPVGSQLVCEKYLPEVSPATIRNEMAELEENGLVSQPHVSAGRIPTLAGYKYYLEKFVGEGKIVSKHKQILDDLSQGMNSDRESLKNLAKALAEISEEAVLVGFSPLDVYYTGISNLFRQPEFLHHQSVFSMSEIIDHLDEVMAEVFSQVTEKAKIFLGEENPFGNMSSVVLAKCRLGNGEGLIGIMGPNRMNYEENLGLLKYSQEIFNNLS